MKIVRTGALIAVIVMIILSLGFTPLFSIEAEGQTQVYIDVKPKIYPGDSFIVRACISEVANLEAYQIQLSYDQSVIQLVGDEGGPEGITQGLIGSTAVDVDVWSYMPPGSNGGTIRVTGRVYDNLTASGAGYLNEFHFRAVGTIGQHSDLTFTEGRRYKNGLFDDKGEKITSITLWSGNSVQVVSAEPLQIVSSILPVGVAGRDYQAQLTAMGGYPPYTWGASGLPPELTLTESGSLNGTTSQSGDIWISVRVQDDYSPPNVTHKDMVLKTCPLGDANEDGKVTKTDVYKTLRIYMGIDAPTRAADANADGKIDMTDAVQIQRLYLSQ